MTELYWGIISEEVNPDSSDHWRLANLTILIGQIRQFLQHPNSSCHYSTGILATDGVLTSVAVNSRVAIVVAFPDIDTILFCLVVIKWTLQ